MGFWDAAKRVALAPFSNGNVQPGPKRPDVPDTQAYADGSQLFNEWHARVMEELGSIPESARNSFAMQVGEAVRKAYVDAINSGKSPGDARVAAEQAGQTTLTGIAQANGVQLASTPQSGNPADANGGVAAVGPEDVRKAWEQFQTGQGRSNELYGDLQNTPTNAPNARNVGRKIVGYEKKRAEIGWDSRNDEPIYGMVDDPTKPIYGDFEGVKTDDVKAAQAGDIENITAALQQRTTVGQNAYTKDLEATARGQGAGQAAAKAASDLILQRGAQQASGLAAQSRGSERRGARRAALLGQGEQALAAANQGAELTAKMSAEAQTKLADLDNQLKATQAQLDQAKAAGDQDAINAATQKMADLRARRQEFNTTQQNDIAVKNRQQTSQEKQFNIGAEQTGVTQGSQQDVAYADLKLRVDEAAQKAAQGLLNEAQRQELISEAREKLKLAQQELALQKDEAKRKAKQDEVNGWLAVLQAATSIGTAVATKSDRRAKEGIHKVSPDDLDEFTSALERSLSTYKYKPGEGPPGPQVGGMAQDLKRTEIGKGVVSTGDDGMDRVDYDKARLALDVQLLKLLKGMA